MSVWDNNWSNLSNINSGNQFTNSDYLSADPVNKAINNIGFLYNKANTIESDLSALTNNVYTKSEINTNFYTNTQINNLLNNKVNTTNFNGNNLEEYAVDGTSTSEITISSVGLYAITIFAPNYTTANGTAILNITDLSSDFFTTLPIFSSSSVAIFYSGSTHKITLGTQQVFFISCYKIAHIPAISISSPTYTTVYQYDGEGGYGYYDVIVRNPNNHSGTLYYKESSSGSYSNVSIGANSTVNIGTYVEGTSGTMYLVINGQSTSTVGWSV